jgi:tetratricopeptide (TPR) repeat protein
MDENVQSGGGGTSPAQGYLERSLQLCHLELGELYRETGRFPLARQHFEFVVRFYPDYDPTLFSSLAGVYVALGDPRSAAAILRKGLRLFPADPELRRAVLRR